MSDLEDGEITSDDENVSSPKKSKISNLCSPRQAPVILDHLTFTEDLTKKAKTPTPKKKPRKRFRTVKEEPEIEVRISENNSKNQEPAIERSVYTRDTVSCGKVDLPTGWAFVEHHNGMPFYYHPQTQVVTWSRPYLKEAGHLKDHQPPLWAIPCYEKYLISEKEVPISEKEKSGDISNIQSYEDFENSMEKFTSYLDKRFPVTGHTIELMKITPKEKVLDGSIANTKYMFVSKIGGRLKQFICLPVNGLGRSSLCVLNEFLAKAGCGKPCYSLSDFMANSSTSQNVVTCDVIIDEINFASVTSCSKKSAKLLAAKAALLIIAPKLADKSEPTTGDLPPILADEDNSLEGSLKPIQEAISFFSNYEIDDPIIVKLIQDKGLFALTPKNLLRNCIQRNYDSLDLKPSESITTLPNGRFLCNLSFMKCTCEAEAGTMLDSQQMAAAKILAEMHKMLKNYGSLIKLYYVNPNIVRNKTERAIAKSKFPPDKNLGEAMSGILEHLRHEIKKTRQYTSEMLIKPNDVENFYTRLWALKSENS